MNVLVTGAKGQLGFDVVKRLNEQGIDYLGIDKNDADITNEHEIKSVILGYKPDVVIHCAAYTAVDKAEDERELCYQINVLGTRYIAEACKEISVKMVYISTDYVFDGQGDKPFEVDDIPNPINYYGETKYQGEVAVKELVEKYFIVRISWVFGENGSNFVKTMLRLAEEKKEISVVADQVGSPTYTYELAEFLIKLVNTEKYGIYHATNEGYCSWYEFACEIFKQRNIDIKVNPISSGEYKTAAKRPKNSKLSKKSLDNNTFLRLIHWKDSLFKFFQI